MKTYDDFVHFSSAYERLENFKYKLTLIQNYQSDLNSLKGLDELTDIHLYICLQSYYTR
jgi:hypothetical protein